MQVDDAATEPLISTTLPVQHEPIAVALIPPSVASSAAADQVVTGAGTSIVQEAGRFESSPPIAESKPPIPDPLPEPTQPLETLPPLAEEELPETQALVEDLKTTQEEPAQFAGKDPEVQPSPGTDGGTKAPDAENSADKKAPLAAQVPAAPTKYKSAAPPGAERAMPPLRLKRAPLPDYPRAARRAGVSGVATLLEVHITADGRIVEAAIIRSCGRADMDRAALNTVRRRWRFENWDASGREAIRQENVRIVWQLKR